MKSALNLKTFGSGLKTLIQNYGAYVKNISIIRFLQLYMAWLHAFDAKLVV